MQQNKTEQLASTIIGDGKSPNKYFVTVGFGWYIPFKDYDETSEEPFEMPEMIQAKDAIDGTSLGPFNSMQKARELVYNNLVLPVHPDKITGDMLTQAMIEDRKTGVVIEKRLWETRKGYFVIDEF